MNEENKLTEEKFTVNDMVASQQTALNQQLRVILNLLERVVKLEDFIKK